MVFGAQMVFWMIPFWSQAIVHSIGVYAASPGCFRDFRGDTLI
jgi:hypothetical protein